MVIPEDMDALEPERVDTGKLWAGGIATAVVAGFTVVAGVLVAGSILRRGRCHHIPHPDGSIPRPGINPGPCGHVQGSSARVLAASRGGWFRGVLASPILLPYSSATRAGYIEGGVRRCRGCHGPGAGGAPARPAGGQISGKLGASRHFRGRIRTPGFRLAPDFLVNPGSGGRRAQPQAAGTGHARQCCPARPAALLSRLPDRDPRRRGVGVRSERNVRRADQRDHDSHHSAPSVATRTALIVCIRFSAWSKTIEYGDSKTSSVTSSASSPNSS